MQYTNVTGIKDKGLPVGIFQFRYKFRYDQVQNETDRKRNDLYKQGQEHIFLN